MTIFKFSLTIKSDKKMNTQKLEKLHACSEAIEYVKTQKSAISAWKNCPRGDWMLWLASEVLKLYKKFK
jgi:hypothetical protein